MSKVLVTGASGRIGRALVAELSQTGHEVIGLYRSTPGPDPSVKWLQADITLPDSYTAALEGCNAVINLAVEFDPRLMSAVNVIATQELMRAARAAGVKYFGFASSVVVYGSPARRLISEDTPLIDPSLRVGNQYLAEPFMLEYALSKVRAEQALTSDWGHGIVLDIYRPTVVVPVEELLQAKSWSLMRKAVSAHRTTQFITMVDAVSAIRHLMERGLRACESGIEVYNLADESCGCFADLLAKAFQQTNDKCFRVKLRLPPIVDRVHEIIKYKSIGRHNALGRLIISNSKLRATGFVFPLGMGAALDVAIADFMNKRC